MDPKRIDVCKIWSNKGYIYLKIYFTKGMVFVKGPTKGTGLEPKWWHFVLVDPDPMAQMHIAHYDGNAMCIQVSPE